MKILAIIPARFASVRFPGKPLADIRGKSMIRRVYERASSVFDNCLVATDDIRIFNEITGCGGKAVMTSCEHKSGTERCYEALVKTEEKSRESFDVVINIQGDEPCISPVQLRELAGCFEDNQTQIATLVKRFEPGENIFDQGIPKVVLSGDLYALYFSRSVIPCVRGEKEEHWAKKAIYYKHIGLYGYTRKVLSEIVRLGETPAERAEKLEQLRWLENGYRIKVAVTLEPSFSIDTPEDLEKLLSGNHISI
ncbi:MAG: 3-deoxy-manno-octulosonate cytidylyltransferase [Bacteroidales bacterium]|nr:3-deoxy-manno-octulosonate cytidylyltransferase [Bacteroidales bacterium]MDD3990353.1 3-deoxy-manno-octulosonate cytidylyltransferase [Bacteroidales bacterium]MDD4639264.1 3-deoxy-manno-octulosonate cytidylyltransferase [Bacteroidales bacterium]